MERGESATAFPWQNTESEPNNSIQAADNFKNIQGGVINSPSDVDYFKMYVDGFYWHDLEDDRYPMLVDVEAQSIGSPLDTVICLYSDDFLELACNDDTDTLDSMLYYNLESWRTYYLSVESYENLVGGSDYRYQILTSSPLLISAASGGLGTGTVDGIPFQAGDILAWSNFRPGDKWVMLVDLSDLNVKANLTNLAAGWRNSDYLMVGFAANVRLPGISFGVTPWDVVLFNPTTVGPRTEGVFQGWWRGQNHGLTTTAEKIDAIDWPNWEDYGYWIPSSNDDAASLLVSTTGTASVMGIPNFDYPSINPPPAPKAFKLADEDIGFWHSWVSWYYPAGDQWARYIDNSLVPGLAGEDVIALTHSFEIWDDPPLDHQDLVYQVFQGTALCGPAPARLFTQKDIVRLVLDYTNPGDDIYVPCGLSWHGPDWGWNYNIDAIDVTSVAGASWWDESGNGDDW